MPAQSVVRLDARGQTVLYSGCPFLNIFTRKMGEPNYRASVALALLAYNFLKLCFKNSELSLVCLRGRQVVS